jgi:hypothetical protein
MMNKETTMPFANMRLAASVVSALVIFGFVAVLLVLLIHPVDLSNGVADIFKILTGTLAAKFGDVVQYNIGSSAGSKAKDDILNGLVTPATPKAP